MTAYRAELHRLARREFGKPLLNGMSPLELAKLCESARAVCESSEEMPSFNQWCSTKGLPHSTAAAFIEKFERGGFSGQG